MLQVRKEAANALTGIGEAAAPEIVVEDLAGESRPDDQSPLLQMLAVASWSYFLLQQGVERTKCQTRDFFTLTPPLAGSNPAVSAQDVACRERCQHRDIEM